MLIRVATVVSFIALVAAGCEKDKKDGEENKAENAEGTPAAAPAPTPGATPTGTPTAGGGALKLPGAGALGALFGGGNAGAPATKKKSAPPMVAGLFGGKIDMGTAMGAADEAVGRGKMAVPPVAEPPTATTAKAPAAPPKPTPTSVAKGKGNAGCAQVANHLVKIMADELEELPPQAAGMIKQEVVQTCQNDNWSPAAIQCVLAAKDEEGLESCEDQLPYGGQIASGDDDDDDDLGTPQPVKVANGNPANCGAVVDKLLDLAMAEIPADQRAMVVGMMDQVKQQAVDQCVASGGIPDTGKTCIMAATSMQDIQTKCASALGGL